MEKELQELEKAIELYRKCEDVDAAEHIIGNAIYKLMITCNKVRNTCARMIECI